MALTLDNKLKQPGTPNTGPKPQAGSGFTNLNRVIGANQGNKLGQAIGGGISNVAGQAKQNINQQSQEFQQHQQANQLGTEQDRSKFNQILQDPTKANDQDVQDFARFRTGQYNGPQGLQNAQQIQGQAQAAQQLGNAAADAGGRQGLLQRFVGNNQYSQGQQNLDNLLLGRTGGDQLRQARRATQGLETQASNATQNAQNIAAQNTAIAAKFGQDVNAGIKGKQDPLLEALKGRVGTAESEREAKLNQYRQDLASGEISQEAAQELGLSEGQDLYGANLGNLLGKSSTMANQQNVANEQETANLNALARLGGQSQFSDPTQAGSFYKNQLTYDPKEAAKIVAQQKARYEEEANPYRNAANVNKQILANNGAMQRVNEARNEFNSASGSLNEFMRSKGILPAEAGEGQAETQGKDVDTLSPEDMQKYQQLQDRVAATQQAQNSVNRTGQLSVENIHGLVNSLGLDPGYREQVQNQMNSGNYGGAVEMLKNYTQQHTDQLNNVENKYNPNKKLKFKSLQQVGQNAGS